MRHSPPRSQQLQQAIPLPLILVSWISGSAVIIAGVILVSDAHNGSGVFLIACGPLGWLILYVAIGLVRRRAAGNLPKQSSDWDSGHVSGGTDGAVYKAAAHASGQSGRGEEAPVRMGQNGIQDRDVPESRRWVGGMNIPTATGRLSATMPLAVLELSGSTLVFRIRPRWVLAMVGARIFEAAAGDGTVIFPVHQLAGVGVGIRSRGQPAWYFRSFSNWDILAAASAAGFEVSTTLGRWGT